MIKITKNGWDYTVYPDRNIVASNTDEFKNQLAPLIDEAPEKLIIDLTGVEIVDSIGIGVLIATFNSLNKIGSKLEIVNVSDNIYNTLTTMRLNNYFAIKKK